MDAYNFLNNFLIRVMPAVELPYVRLVLLLAAFVCVVVLVNVLSLVIVKMIEIRIYFSKRSAFRKSILKFSGSLLKRI